MKIALVSEHASPLASPGGPEVGGQNVHVAELSAALAAQGHNVTVFTRRDDAHMPTVVTHDGYRVVQVPAGPATYVPRDSLLVHMKEFGNFLHRWWATERPDIVHAHFWMSALATCDAAVPLHIPSVITFHALGSVKRRYQGLKDTSPADRIRLEQCVAHKASRIVATCSDEVSELARMGVAPQHSTVIPCGVDTELFCPQGDAAAKSTPRILTVGRLVPRKGYRILINALKDVPEAELVIAGGPDQRSLKDDPEVKRLREQARTAGVDQRVTFLGQVAHLQMPELIRSADVVACTPLYEPFGIVPVEAMACGRPVVAAAVGGFKDTVRDGKTGFLVPPANPTALVAALRKILGDQQLGDEMGRTGREIALDHYTWHSVAEQTADVYRNLIAPDRAFRAAV